MKMKKTIKRVGLNTDGLMPKLTKAPPPVTPVRGGTTKIFTKKDPIPTPNWDEWKHIPNVEIWQACLLSLNIDPNSMVHSAGAWQAGNAAPPIFASRSFPNEASEKAYESRLRELIANSNNPDYFSPEIICLNNPKKSMVRPAEFLNWALKTVSWQNIPDQLSAMANKSINENSLETHRLPTDRLGGVAVSGAMDPRAAFEDYKDYEISINLIRCKEGTHYIKYSHLSHLIAAALYPELDDGDYGSNYDDARSHIKKELKNAVQQRELSVKDPRSKGPHAYPKGDLLLRSEVTVDDFRGFLKLTQRPIQVVVIERVSEDGKEASHKTSHTQPMLRKKGGRPRTNGQKSELINRLVEAMTIGKEITKTALPGRAADLMEACVRIARENNVTPNPFKTTIATFNGWLKNAGHGFPHGRTKKNETKYWTNLCVETMAKIPVNIFTKVDS
jgi:hypothetical protein